MTIAIHAAELDVPRVDGTRTYISEMLTRFAAYAPEQAFSLYHKKPFADVFAVPHAHNYDDRTVPTVPWWTQTAFAAQLWCDQPEVLWMPLHNLPRVRHKSLRTVVTIHDLAFKMFPETFPAHDVRKLNLHTDYAVRHADHLIAVSEATKRDLMRFYPELSADNVTVIHHGFDAQMWKDAAEASENLLARYNITKPYIVYLGAIQPRKNLSVLIAAFEQVKKTIVDLQLVLVGADAWMAAETHKRAQASPYAQDIIFTGSVSQEEKRVLLHSAQSFVYPSLYEGFGIPLLEAFAAGVSVITADNSSLAEVAADAALLFDAHDAAALAAHIKRVFEDPALRADLVTKGTSRVRDFSWDAAATKTLDVILGGK